MSVETIKQELAAVGAAEEVVSKAIEIIQKEKEVSYDAGVGKAYGEVDTVVKDIFGIDKNEKEFATEYLKRSFKTTKSGLENSIESKFLDIRKENETLKEQLKTVPDAAKYEDLRKQHNNVLEDFAKEKNDMLKNFETEKKKLIIEANINSLPFSVEDKEYLRYQKEVFINDILKRGFDVIDSDGKKILRGGETEGHKDYVLEDFAKEKLSHLIKKQGTGLRTDEPDPTNTTLINAKSKNEAFSMIRKSLEEKGYNVTQPTWAKVWAEELEKQKIILQKLE